MGVLIVISVSEEKKRMLSGYFGDLEMVASTV